MVAIHGAVFFIIGIIVTGFSIYFNNTLSTEDNQPFLLFIYLGIFFMLLGLFKWLWPHIRERKEKKPMQTQHTMHPAHQAMHPGHMQHPSHHPQHPIHQAQHPIHHPAHPYANRPVHAQQAQQQPVQSSPAAHHTYTVHYCPGCRSPLEPHHNYCSHCGGRIR